MGARERPTGVCVFTLAPPEDQPSRRPRQKTTRTIQRHAVRGDDGGRARWVERERERCDGGAATNASVMAMAMAMGEAMGE